MKPVYFYIICAVVAHPNKGTITKLRVKTGVHSICLLGNPINGAILTKAFSFPQAFSHLLEIWSSQFSFQSNLAPSNSSHSLFSTSYLPIFPVIFSLLLISKRHLPGLFF